MAIQKSIGGDRLGSGAKMKVDLKTYNRSTHDLGYIFRTTMASGTLIPFIKEVALPGDTFDIDMDVDVKTHPTIGPLFGSYKVQLDVFQAPIRLYQSALHNNAIGIGLKMQDIKLPQISLDGAFTTKNLKTLTPEDIEKLSYNPSSLLSYLDINGAYINRGVQVDEARRLFNGVPYIAYWDIYKNYYANKQEEIGMFINVTQPIMDTVTASGDGNYILPDTPNEATSPQPLKDITQIVFNFEEPVDESVLEHIYLGIDLGGAVPNFINVMTHFQNYTFLNTDIIQVDTPRETESEDPLVNYRFDDSPESYTIHVESFPLENIDNMREDILASGKYAQFEINKATDAPYGDSLQNIHEGTGKQISKSQYAQQGLALKTYQSDLFNNWMSTEWIDNASTGINAITAIDTSEGSFTIDTLNLASKVYDMLNRIAISGGTYDDWLETVYTHEYINRSETPIYHGGLSRELVFQEVVSNSESESGQPLGTLAGKGVMAQKKKGGKVVIKIDEPSYIMGLVSITPRIDYSQGNKWDVNLKTMDDLHKPALDEIGFQDLITEQMGWWTTNALLDGTLAQKSAGKQPAWINYMTNVNKVKGNFALENNEMFMTLNRRYEVEPITTGASAWEVTYGIKDLTTYIDPSKFNFIFAETDLTSQNFWTQIAVDITARRKMSAKIMPNL